MTEELPSFLKRPGRPEIADPVTARERLDGTMPALRDEPRDRWIDGIVLLGIGAFFGALLALAIERFWS